MKPDALSLLHKAGESLLVAKKLFEDGHCDFAAGRAYYAMFYAAEAALLERGLSFSSHRALHSGFFHELIDPGILDRSYHQSLVRGFALRQAGDYGGLNTIEPSQCKDLIEKAEAFLTAIRRLADFRNCSS